MDMEITVVDDSDAVGFAASMFREGELYMTNVSSMVKNVLAALRVYTRSCSASGSYPYSKMSPLNILDHGNKDGLEIGSDWITTASLSNKHNRVYRFNFGDYVRADPKGTFKTGIARP